jgi:hypothetical protein
MLQEAEGLLKPDVLNELHKSAVQVEISSEFIRRRARLSVAKYCARRIASTPYASHVHALLVGDRLGPDGVVCTFADRLKSLEFKCQRIYLLAPVVVDHPY